MGKQPCVIVGVAGGIAAYKVCSVVSHLTQRGMTVKVIMTREAQAFVGPLTFQTLSHQKVYTEMFTTDFEPDVKHISLAKEADLIVLAPATANLIAKVAHGLADDMLTTVVLASSAPKLIVPAMNTGMLSNPATQENLAACRRFGMQIMESGEGMLACGDEGRGRLPEPEEIEDAILEMLEKDKFLKGKKILITAGPTQEALDPVRFLTNHSSGKMGYALARAARNFGAQVTLVTGPTHLEPLRGVEMVPVVSARDMAAAVLPRQQEMDVLILAAAVADYTPAHAAEEKMHKDELPALSLQQTTDILETLGKNKEKGQVLIGFSMETEGLEERSREKLVRKNCDFIVANNLREKGAGFATDTNRVTIFGRQDSKALPLLSKEETARQILQYCLKGEKKNAADH
jgi:phosphopantothenoylcysteine decarboxylase/phosphopantothenate--cysteine ligase